MYLRLYREKLQGQLSAQRNGTRTWRNSGILRDPQGVAKNGRTNANSFTRVQPGSFELHHECPRARQDLALEPDYSDDGGGDGGTAKIRSQLFHKVASLQQVDVWPATVPAKVGRIDGLVMFGRIPRRRCGLIAYTAYYWHVPPSPPCSVLAGS